MSLGFSTRRPSGSRPRSSGSSDAPKLGQVSTGKRRAPGVTPRHPEGRRLAGQDKGRDRPVRFDCLMPSAIFRDSLLDNSVAVVSGGGSGIGRTTALELSAVGARVTICGRRLEPLEATVALDPHGRIDTAACDIRDEEQVDAMVEGVLARHGQVDLLVNNAGGQFLTPAENISPKGFRTVIRLNVEGTWNMTYAVATKAMIPSGRGGKVVSVTLSPHNGMPGMVHSGAARAAVENMMRTLSIEWARFGIRLCAVAPGQIETDTFRDKYPADVVAASSEGVPLGRLGDPEEIAWMIAFLASPAGDFVSGAVLTVDGARDNWYGTWPPANVADERGSLEAEARRPSIAASGDGA